MNSSRVGYIFRCTSSTEDECFERNLFGDKESYKEIIKQVNPGDVLFLYNGTTSKLHGEFIADTQGTFGIEPEAWDGQYPWQVRMKRVKEFNPILRTGIDKVVTFRGKWPAPTLDERQLENLRGLFEKAQALPSDEEEFRKKYEAKYRADDGHMVRSQGELNIDNWLFHQQICHGYERKLPNPENHYCDFFIPVIGSKDYVYIEYWGREDERYQSRKKSKITTYKKYNMNLIELTPSDLEILDDVLPRKLRTYLKELPIY